MSHSSESDASSHSANGDQDRWESLANTASDYVLILDRQCRIQYINRTVPGLLMEDVIGSDVFSHVTPETQDGMRQALQSVFATGEYATFESQSKGQDGEFIWYSSRAGPLATDGKTTGVVLVATDVTRRKLSEREIRESEHRFKDLFNSSPDAIFVENLQGQVLDANPAACRLHGMTRDELIMRHVMELVPDHSREQAKIDFGRLVSGEVTRMQGFSLHKDGHEIPVELRVNHLQYNHQPALLLHARDITQQKRAERQLIERENRLKLLNGIATRTTAGLTLEQTIEQTVADLFQQQPEFRIACYTVDRIGKMRRLQHRQPDSMDPPLAYTRVDATHRASIKSLRTIESSDLLEDDDLAGMRETFKRAGTKSLIHVPFSYVGDTIAILAMESSEPYQWSDHHLLVAKEVAEYLSLATKAVQAREQRHKAEERLRAEERVLRTLLTLQDKERQLVSYEIHDGFIQDVIGAHMLLQTVNVHDSPTLQEVRRLLVKAIREGRRMIGELRPMIIDEMGIVQAVQFLINEQNAASDTDREVEFICRGDFQHTLPTLEGVIFRVVQEAITNVRRHSSAKSAMVRLTAVPPDHVVIEINDNGVGFDTSQVVPDDHFGLEGIRERARLFGGTTKIESAPNEGTRVTVKLPLHPPLESHGPLLSPKDPNETDESSEADWKWTV